MALGQTIASPASGGCESHEPNCCFYLLFLPGPLPLVWGSKVAGSVGSGISWLVGTRYASCWIVRQKCEASLDHLEPSGQVSQMNIRAAKQAGWDRR